MGEVFALYVLYMWLGALVCAVVFSLIYLVITEKPGVNEPARIQKALHWAVGGIIAGAVLAIILVWTGVLPKNFSQKQGTELKSSVPALFLS